MLFWCDNLNQAFTRKSFNVEWKHQKKCDESESEILEFEMSLFGGQDDYCDSRECDDTGENVSSYDLTEH